MGTRLLKNPIPKDKMKIIGQLGKEYLAINSDHPADPRTYAIKWDGHQWIGHAPVDTWIKFTYNEEWMGVDLTLEGAGLTYPEEITIME